METSPNLNLDIAPLLTYSLFSRYMLGWGDWDTFMCLTSIPIYIDHWKSFIKFGIKKSHEMISYIFLGIALLSECKQWSLNEPYNIAQMTLDELYNKTRERFMLSKYQENAPMDHKG